MNIAELDTKTALYVCDGGPPELCGLKGCPYFGSRCDCIQMLHADALDMIMRLESDRDIANHIAKAMGLKMPEITELTDKPIYKEDDNSK